VNHCSVNALVLVVVVVVVVVVVWVVVSQAWRVSSLAPSYRSLRGSDASSVALTTEQGASLLHISGQQQQQQQPTQLQQNLLMPPTSQLRLPIWHWVQRQEERMLRKYANTKDQSSLAIGGSIGNPLFWERGRCRGFGVRCLTFILYRKHSAEIWVSELSVKICIASCRHIVQLVDSKFCPCWLQIRQLQAKKPIFLHFCLFWCGVK